MELGPIDETTFFQYANLRLKTLSKQTFKLIFKHAEGESKLVQHLCRQLKLMEENKKILDDNLAVDRVIQGVDSICRNIFESLSPNGRKIVKMITYQPDNLFNKNSLQKFNISKSSAQSTIESLVKEEIIFKENFLYYLDGGIGSSFSLWCHKKLK